MFRITAVALTITILTALQISLAQNTTSTRKGDSDITGVVGGVEGSSEFQKPQPPATQPETQPATQPDAGKPALPVLTAEQKAKIAALWESLLGDDSEAAAKARGAILEEKDLAIAFLAEEFGKSSLDKQAAAKLIADLDSEVWRKRNAATEKLKAEGMSQADLVLAGIKSAKSPEARLRLEEINKAHEKRFTTALEILISLNSEISWATAHKIIRKDESAGNSKFISISVEGFMSGVNAAVELLFNNRYYYVSKAQEGYGYEASEEELRGWALVQNLSIPTKDRNGLALALLDIAVKLTPDNPECHSQRGMLLHRLGRNDEAQASFTKAIELAPENSDSRLMRGAFFLAVNKPGEAVADFDKAIELTNNDPKMYDLRARAYLKLDKKKEALADYTKAIELAPDYAGYYEARADVYIVLGENDMALADFTAGIKCADYDQYRAWIYNRRAALQGTLGHPDKFIADMKKAIEVGRENPNYSNWCNNLAWFFVTCEDAALRDSKAAVEYGQYACAADPNNPAPLDTLACAYADDGQWPKAIEMQKKAIACTRDANMKKMFMERLEGFKKNKTYLKQEAEKKKKAEQPPPATQPEPETQPDVSEAVG